MAVCPKCENMIAHLDNYQSGKNHYRLYADGYSEMQEFQENNKLNDYECPECSEVLFTDDEKAREFITGKED